MPRSRACWLTAHFDSYGIQMHYLRTYIEFFISELWIRNEFNPDSLGKNIKLPKAASNLTPFEWCEPSIWIKPQKSHRHTGLWLAVLCLIALGDRQRHWKAGALIPTKSWRDMIYMLQNNINSYTWSWLRLWCSCASIQMIETLNTYIAQQVCSSLWCTRHAHCR